MLLEKTVRLPTGVTLQYVEQGEARGTPMLLLHGITDSWRSFEPVLPLLPPSIRAFAITQRGHGDADKPARGYRTRDFAADLEAFAETVGIGPAIVVGHSMGSTHAARFAIDAPARTRGLILVGAFASYGGNAGLRDFYHTTLAGLEDPVPHALALDFQVSTLARQVPAAFLEKVVAESLKAPARVWRETFAGLLEDDFTDRLSRIGAPTLLLWGDRDAMASRADQDRLLDAIRGARLKVYEGAGHALHWELPEEIARDLTDFALAGDDGPR